MAQSIQILLNGRYHLNGGAILNLSNRAFMYGDSICEIIHSCAGRLCYFSEHIQRLTSAMKLAGMDIPELFLSEQETLRDEISKMLVKNKVFKGANVKIIVFRTDSEDAIITKNNSIEYAVTIETLNQTGFDINKDGLWISDYDKFKKYPSPLWNYQTHENTFLKITAFKELESSLDKLHDVILLNHNGNWASAAIYGNVFVMMKDKTIYTPPLSEGALDDVFRDKVIEILTKSGHKVETQKTITQELAKQADQIFLASTAFGIRWVAAYTKRRFFRTLAQEVATKINQLYQEAE